MTKDELINAVAAKTSYPKKEVDEVLAGVLENIAKALAKGDKVVFTGFGIFKTSKRAARQGINPKTGAKISIAASVVPKFKAGKSLKEAVK